MPRAGIEQLTFGVASRDEDHSTMPLPWMFECLLCVAPALAIQKCFKHKHFVDCYGETKPTVNKFVV